MNSNLSTPPVEPHLAVAAGEASLEPGTGGEGDALTLETLGQTPFLPPREPLGARLAGLMGRHHALLFSLCVAILWAIVALPYGASVGIVQGMPAPSDVIAPSNAYPLDRVATKQRQTAAISLVPPVYDQQSRAQEQALAELYRVVAAARHDAKSPDAVANETVPKFAKTADKVKQGGGRSPAASESPVVRFNRDLEKPLPLSLVAAILAVRAERWTGIARAAEAGVRAVYQGGQVRSDVDDDLAIAGRRVEAALAATAPTLNLSADEKRLAIALARQVARKPNLIVNESATNSARAKALKDVHPVCEQIKAGTVLVKANEIVTEEKWLQLQELGLVETRLDVWSALARLVLCLTLISFCGGYLTCFHRRLVDRPAALWLTAMVPILCVGVFRLLMRMPHADFTMVPVAAAGAMLLTVLMDARVGILSGFVVAALCALLAKAEIGLFLVAGLSSSIGALSVSNIISRNQLVRTAALLAVTNGVLTAALQKLDNAPLDEIISTTIWGTAAGVLSVVAMAGLAMLLERPFGITTHLRLLELLAPDELVMRRMQSEAPGTYTHSLMVSMLAEAAAKTVGADPLLARVGGLYHDIGKLHRPHCFVENQSGDNIHDRLAPQVSALVIKAHVKDGMELGRALGLPQPVMEIIEQHHGTTLISYFYHRALQQAQHSVNESEVNSAHGAPGDDVGMGLPPSQHLPDEALFRYAGPKPQSKEAALVLLADAVEASARALPNPTIERLEEHIRNMVAQRLQEGELSECDLTLRDLGTIQVSFSHVLRGVMHHRISYPSPETEKGDSDGAWMRSALDERYDEAAPRRERVSMATAHGRGDDRKPADKRPRHERSAKTDANPADKPGNGRSKNPIRSTRRLRTRHGETTTLGTNGNGTHSHHENKGDDAVVERGAQNGIGAAARVESGHSNGHRTDTGAGSVPSRAAANHDDAN